MAHEGMLYKPDGTKTRVTPKDGKKFSLAELQEYVEGYIERVPTTGRKTVWVNEEGIIHGLPFNDAGAKAAGYGPLVGNVLVITGNGSKRNVPLVE